MKKLLLVLVMMAAMTSCTSRSGVLEEQTRKSEQLTENLYKLDQWHGLESKMHVEAMLKGISDAYYISYFTLKTYNSEDGTMVYLSSDGVYAVYNVSAQTLTLYRNVIKIELK